MDNKVLLSQSEIDVLIRFLSSNKERINDEVLSQSSVDKLLFLLQTHEQKVYFDSQMPKFREGSGTAILVLAGEVNFANQQTQCELTYEIDQSTNYVKIICINNTTGNKYNMTPRCLERITYLIGDNSEWGYAIPPLTFASIASLLQVKYSKATYDGICELFAERLFGDKKHTIPYIYMPSAQDMLQNMV